MNAVKSLSLPVFITVAAALFYAGACTPTTMVNVDEIHRARGLDPDVYRTGPSTEDAMRAMGEDPDSAVDSDRDPELAPFMPTKSN